MNRIILTSLASIALSLASTPYVLGAGASPSEPHHQAHHGHGHHSHHHHTLLQLVPGDWSDLITISFS